jgi:hypothetical protein
MLIEIKNRFTGAVLYSTDVSDGDLYPIRTALTRACLVGANLVDANLAGANLADANLVDANLADANFARANLVGANLAHANLVDANLADADLAGAYLAHANLVGANLARADLVGADLVGADLAGADLVGADLAGAYLAHANLVDANLVDARNVPTGVGRTDPPTPYHRATTAADRRKRSEERALRYREAHPDVPVVPQLDAKILEQVTNGVGMLDMTDWHHGDACGTTHCRAGWAVFLAGSAGAELERTTSPEHAGRAIYLASTGRVPNFFASTDRALEDLKRCASEQTP